MDWYTISPTDAAAHLGTSMDSGLTAQDARDRLEKDGPNELTGRRRVTLAERFLQQFKDVMVLVLLAAAALSGFALREWTDAAIILAVVLLNAVLGVVQESRSEKALEALRARSAPHAKVVRGGVRTQVPARELVAGDVVLLEAGDIAPADLRLFACAQLTLDESALTGESVPVQKQTEALAAGQPLGDQTNMAFSGSQVLAGRGTGLVTQTGMHTAVGQIAGMLNREQGVQTPLQRRLEGMGKKLALACVLVCALVFAAGILYGHEPVGMFMTAISLAVAAIPEGMLAIVTVVLSMGVSRMSGKNAIIRRLPAVETLGSATVICSDKTGTLTQNRMTVVRAAAPFEPLDGPTFAQRGAPVFLSTAMALCNDAAPAEVDGQKTFSGDPTETALLDFVAPVGYERLRLESRMPRVDEIPFDSDIKRMTTVHRDGKAFIAFTKGGLDEVLSRCTRIYDGAERPLTPEDTARVRAAAEAMAGDALRVLAFAMRKAERVAPPDARDEYAREMTFLGLCGMIDPPRETAREAVARCRRAGIKPVMITGDHPLTAAAIARELGILLPDDRVLTGRELDAMDDDALRGAVRHTAVYARVSPADKLRIVRAWQSHGDVVAMTGDGVNDAPALKRADIGVAMGITGTEVSKEASAMILTDDNFATIVEAVSEGRTIYRNIRKAIQFLLSCNLGELLTVLVATLFNWGTPLLPIHILWVNLITDTFPALALGVEPADPDEMNRPPRDPRAGIFDRRLVGTLAYQGALIALSTLGAFLLGGLNSADTARTMAFAVLALSQIVHTFSVRDGLRSAFAPRAKNRWLLFACGGSLALQLLVLFVPFLQDVFHVVPLTGGQWLVTVGLTALPLLVVEFVKLLRRAARR